MIILIAEIAMLLPITTKYFKTDLFESCHTDPALAFIKRIDNNKNTYSSNK